MRDGFERGVSPIGRGRQWLRTPAQKRAAMGIGGAMLIGFAAWATLGLAPQHKPEAPEDFGSKAIAQVVPSPPLAAPPELMEKPVLQPVAAATPVSPALVPPPPSIAPNPSAPAPPLESYFSGKGTGDPVSRATGGTPTASEPTHVGFKTSELPGAKAGPALNLTYMLMPQYIECALDNAIDSQLPGPIMCHTTQDVLSPRGVVLMAAGTTVIGEYKNSIRTGQNRIFTLSATAYTPEGIPVPLEGPMADGLGRAGVSGEVDNHYLERFGAGVLMALGEGGLGVAQAALSHGNTAFFSFSVGGGVDDVASRILQSQIDIPPTISVPPGAIVTIVVRYPIDFSDALRIRLK